MHSKRFLLIGLLLAVVLTLGLSVAQAQDGAPAKGPASGSGLSREEAVPTLDLPFPPDFETEPNNTIGQADYISHADWFASHVAGTIGAVGDWDMFTFWGLPGDTIAVSVAAARYGSGLDSVITLRDGNGTTLVTNDDYVGLDSYLVYTLPDDGEYTVTVADFFDQHGGPDHWYDLYFWAVSRTSDETAPYGPGSEEPNNTRGTALAIEYADTVPFARLDFDGDIDFYKFVAKAGDRARIGVETTALGGTLETRVALLNSVGTQIASCTEANWIGGSTNCLLEKVIPKAGTYFIKVSDAHNKGGADKLYWLQLGFYEAFEPNNTIAQATTLADGQTVRGLVATGDSRDYFRFYGQAGDYITARVDPLDVAILDSDGTTYLVDTYLCGYGVSFRLPHAGWYYAAVRAAAYTNAGGDYYDAYELTIGRAMLLGVKTNASVSGLAYSKGDILAHYPANNNYRLFLDGSDVGVVKPNLMDFHVFQDDACLYGIDAMEQPSAVLASLSVAAKLASYPGTFSAAPHDIVRFQPWGFGDESSGGWSMFLDGSDIGLTTTNEKIDAVGWTDGPEWSDVVFSTVGTATINSLAGALTAQDEDLVGCSLDQTGLNTVAWCYLFMDGSAVGIPAAADIASVWIHPWFYDGDDPGTDDVYMTFATATTINGVTYKPNDIAVCRKANGAVAVTACAWQPKYWAGDAHGLSGKVIDGLDLLSQQP